MPRTQCGTWTGALIAMHVLSDAAIFLSYQWIPLIMIWVFLQHRSQIKLNVPLALVGLLYVVFIVACGWTHFFDALMFFHPVYRLNGLVRLLTAMASVATAISIVRLIPAAISAPVTIHLQGVSLRQQQQWLRDILDAATDGVLRLCDTAASLPSPLIGAEETRISIRASGDLRKVRQAAQDIAERVGFAHDRVFDLISALHEAAMNSYVHAGGGEVTIYATPELIQIWIEDKGSGIPLDKLPISTLKQGFSTAGTAGQGWFLMLTFVQRAYLMTGAVGTTLVLEVPRIASHTTAVPFSLAVGGDVLA